MYARTAGLSGTAVIIDFKNFYIMATINLQDLREELKSAQSKEELEELTLRLLKKIEHRYLPLHVLAEEGNTDVLERLDFIVKTANGSILDIGCHDGFYAIELAKRGHKVVGLDMLQLCIDYAQERARKISGIETGFVKGFAEDLSFPDNEFDTTYLSHTLEHVFDERKSLEEAARVTKNQGKLVVIVPTKLGNDPTHLRFIPSNDLKKMLMKYGWTSEEFNVGKGIGYVCTISRHS